MSMEGERTAQRLRLVLASGSATRLRVLRDAGFDPDVVPSGADEAIEIESTGDAAVELACRKARAVAPRCPGSLVIGCDSLLEFGGRSLGKPGTPEEATEYCRRLSGRVATLHTGHCIIDTVQGREAVGVAATMVRLGMMSAAEAAAYVATGEPMTMAGGFSLDGYGAPFVDGIEGDVTNVLGLSLPMMRQLLGKLGVPITDLWRSPRGAPVGG
jgi:septum formation protein